jgi:hypothetical protein
MELHIVKKLENTLEKEGKRLQDDATLASFEHASVEFEKLVQSGIVKRRGYNLMTIEGKHLQQFSINSNLI